MGIPVRLSRSGLERLFLTVGMAAGTGWFAFNRWLDYAPMPEQADAATYFRISNGFQSFGEAIAYLGERTFGFPLFLYSVKRVVLCFSDPAPATLIAIQATTLLLLHFAASWFFYRALVARLAQRGKSLHPLALLLILLHPGLIGHASVLLTDTFSTDLLMLASGLLLGGDSGTAVAPVIRGLFAGLLMGWVVAARPFALLTFLALVPVALALWAWSKRPRGLALLAGAFFLGGALVLVPSALECRSRFGRVCLQDPGFSGAAASQSLELGLSGVRVYWSTRSPWASTMVVVDDWGLKDIRGPSCPVGGVTGPAAWLRCFTGNPAVVPEYAYKKIVGLLDSTILQPYAADATPRWVRLLNRGFGALTFFGLLCALFLAGEFTRQRRYGEALAFSLPLLMFFSYIPMHPEARYSFPVVPICIASAVWLAQRSRAEGRGAVVVFIAVASLASVIFLAQTHAWDLNDLILQQIEGWDR